MISFEDIRKANEAIVTTGISRKDKNTGKTIVKEYAEVNQRIKAFRMVHPNGTITTDIISLENGVVTMKACVLNEEGVMLGSGYAQEKETSSFINQTSFIENCETSAVGRALGMCGFGIDTSVASLEEVQNAINNQQETPAVKTKETPVKKNLILATDKQVVLIKNLYSEVEIKTMLSRMKKKSLEEITIEEASKMISTRQESEAGLEKQLSEEINYGND